MKNYDVIIVGAGPSGLMSAYTIQGKSVLLLDANSQIGGKLKVSGGGRCNVSNNKDIESFLKFVPKNNKFLYSCFSKFSPINLINFFNNNNVYLKEEDNGRMFPKSNDSNSIIEFFYDNLINKIDIKLNFLVDKIDYTNENFIINDSFSSKYLIMATGGISYPNISQFDIGHNLLENLGHSYTNFLPSSTPLVINNDLISSKDLQGISLKNCEAYIYVNEKKKVSSSGDILFTHFGLSGPLALNLSYYIAKFLDENKSVKLVLKPSQKVKKIIPYLENEVIELNVNDVKGMKTAFLTNGGIKIKEVNSNNFESKLIKNLFIAGELLDIHAFTGGYNIAICFCEGKVIGDYLNEN